MISTFPLSVKNQSSSRSGLLEKPPRFSDYDLRNCYLGLLSTYWSVIWLSTDGWVLIGRISEKEGRLLSQGSFVRCQWGLSGGLARLVEWSNVGIDSLQVPQSFPVEFLLLREIYLRWSANRVFEWRCLGGRWLELASLIVLSPRIRPKWLHVWLGLI